MKALIYILAILLMAAGVAVALMSFFSPGEVVLGLNLGLAATLFTGGVVTLALAAVVTAVMGVRRQLKKLASEGAAGWAEARVERRPAARLAAGAGVAAAAAVAAPAKAEEAEEVRREEAPAAEEVPVTEEEVVAAVAEAAEAVAEEAEAAEAPAGAEEVEEAEEAEEAEEEEAPAEAEAAAEEEEEAAEGEELYVVEERIVHGRPARMLSDGTVEAETDEGWMRFENLEHLEEYMAAMGHAR
jgi:hypothetical protein